MSSLRPASTVSPEDHTHRALHIRPGQEAAPVLVYPDQLTTGSHRIYIHGASGPVALLSTGPTPGTVRYCADLSTLVGRRLHPESETAPTASPTLF